MNKESSKTRIKNIFLLQGAVAIYSLTTICARFASGEKLLSPRFILFFGLEIVVLGIYAADPQGLRRLDRILQSGGISSVGHSLVPYTFQRKRWD